MQSEQKKSTAQRVAAEFEDKRGRAQERLAEAIEGLSKDQDTTLLVRDVMTCAPATAAADATAVDAARAMVAENVGSLPVVEEGVVVGMVTDRDLVAHVMARDLDPGKVSVSEFCSENPIVAHPEEPLDAALQRMAEAQVRRLPVVDGQTLVGIVAQADVARSAELESVGALVQEISWD